MTREEIEELDKLGEPYKILASIVYKAKRPVRPEEVNSVWTKWLFKKTYPIDKNHFEKLEEHGFLEKTEDGYATSELFEEWLRENTKTRKAKLREKLVNPLGLNYFHEQKYSFENLLAVSEKQEEMKDEYKKIGRKAIKDLTLKFWLPSLTVAVTGMIVDPMTYGKYVAIGGMIWFLFGYNYVECKMGEDVANLVEKHKEEVL